MFSCYTDSNSSPPFSSLESDSGVLLMMFLAPPKCVVHPVIHQARSFLILAQRIIDLRGKAVCQNFS